VVQQNQSQHKHLLQVSNSPRPPLMSFDLKLVYTRSCCDLRCHDTIIAIQVRRRATIYVSCHLMSWKGNYCLERTDSVSSECLAELIRLIRPFRMHRVSVAPVRNQLHRMQLLHAASNYLNKLAIPVQKGSFNIKAHFITRNKCDSSISVAFRVPVI
jgi:hypothetical protein